MVLNLGLLVSKCMTARLWGLTQRKMSLLEGLAKTWKGMVSEEKSYRELRQAFPNISALYARNASFKRKSANDPIYLETQDFRLIDTKKKFARWFVRIPIRKGVAVFAPLRMRKRDSLELPSVKIHDSKLVKKNGMFELHLSVSKEVEMNYAYRSVFGVDLGERVMATAVLSSDASNPAPKFYGKNVRSIRRHNAWLRKRLGERKILRVIRRIRNTEQRTVNVILHQISRAIVDEALANNAVIVLGDLEGIRSRARGKRMNRIIANMPFHKLTEYISYKANWEGIPVITTSEAYTSKTCHNCNSEGRRVNQGLFRCSACGHEYNADYNGAANIGKKVERLLEHVSLRRASGSTPIRGAIF
ncbi:MAG: IS200/IS605 family element transposase accessory protein TnpB [Thaumarchaeota archaeon]|nr:IS200/IS605 family element transposase accessory protein TnpB [Nitrososphaerota archaeon]